jgi:hypothetical protein
VKTLAEQAAEALNSLGDTPDEIAENLRGAGFRGLQNNGRECPCGSCLQDHFPGVIPHVASTCVYITGTADRGPLGEAVQDFIYRFDAGLYPDLVAK